MLLELNVLEKCVPSDWIQCVVESAPESMSASSGTHLKNKVKPFIAIWPWPQSNCKSGQIKHTFCCLEERRYLKLDCPPGTLNWGWLQQDRLRKKQKRCFIFIQDKKHLTISHYTGKTYQAQPGCCSLIGCRSESTCFLLVKILIPRREKVVM